MRRVASLSMQKPATRGIVFMLCGMSLLSIMDGLAKLLVMQDIHSIEVLAVRGVIIVPILVAFYTLRGKPRELLPTRPVAQALRGAAGIFAPLSFFMAIKTMPLSSAVVIFYSSIFMTTVLSVIVLRERVGIHRWLAVIVGYIGVFIAMSPGLDESGGGNLKGYLLVLVSSLSYAMLFITGRLLSRTDTVPSMVMSYNAWVGGISLVALPWFWHMPTPTEWGLLILLAAFAVAGHFFVTTAFKLTEASVIAPLEYTTVLWAVLFDILIWNHVAGGATWLGAVVIILSGLYVIHREHVSGKNQAKQQSHL
ncbi:MAG: DMT family transporter [Granulosicoccus sp.]|nr:DMT family transporter [Granulosicoccus sp.]